jgi:hypothetical protein
MNTTEYHRIKLQGSDAVSDAVVGVADELFEMRKNNDETLYQLKNIAGSLDFIGQYLYDISWELKKNKEEKALDKTTQS